LGSLRILAASRIRFKGRVRPRRWLSAAPSRLQAKPLYRVRGLTSVRLSNHYCCGALPPFSSYHPLSWTTVPFLRTSLSNRALFAFWQLPGSYLRATYALSLSKMALRSILSTPSKSAFRLPLEPSLLQRVAPFLQLPSSLMDHSPVPPHLVTQ